MIPLASNAPVDRRPVIALLTATGISEAGNVLTSIAIPWLVLQTTGSAARAGIAVAAVTLATLVGGFFGGVLVDRAGHKQASVVADLASGLTTALIPFLMLVTGLDFWPLVGLVFLGALLDSPGSTARRSLLPTLAQRAGFTLDRTNATHAMVARTALLLAPPAGGLLIGLIGTANLLWINAATFAVSAAIVAVAVPRAATIAVDAEAEPGPNSYFGELRAGLHFILQERLVFWLVFTAVVGGVIAEPVYNVILPVYADQVFDSPVALGIMYSALAAGSLLGNVLFLVLVTRLPRRLTFVLGYLVRALTFWLLVPLPPLPVVASSIVVNATALETSNPIMQTALQERVPAALRGRVFGTMFALSAGARSVGFIVYGVFLQELGLARTLMILAVVNMALPVSLILVPAFRELDRRPVSATLPPAG